MGQFQAELSEPDPQGRRLLLINRWSVRCASAWMGLAYSVYRVGLPSGASESLLSGQHGFWLGSEPPEFVLKPNEIIIELQDYSVDTTIHNRTQLHRYNFGTKGVTRLDPVAFQPQDFAEEWLTRPWSEMQSRSAPETEEWHAKLHGDHMFADYSEVAACHDRPDRWLIGLSINQIGQKELAPPLTAYFLVHDLGNYRCEMEAVSASRPSGCPGTGSASEKHPWLSVDELKAPR